MQKFCIALILLVGLCHAQNVLDTLAKDLREISKAEERSREDLAESQPDTRNPDESSKESEESSSEEEDEGLSSVFEGLPNIFQILRSPGYRPWWQGPNVCVEREETEETTDTANQSSGIFMFGSAQFSSCKQTSTKYICTTVTTEGGRTKTAKVTYQCCHGFRRSVDSIGCSKVELKPLVNLTNELGASQFSKMISQLGVESELDSQNLTFFCPTDEAFSGEKLSVLSLIKGEGANEVGHEASGSEGLIKFVRSHVVKGLLDKADMYDNRVLTTENNSTIRLNVYPGRDGPIVTVNCGRMASMDHFSTHGVIHMVNSTLPPVSQSLAAILESPQYSEFAQLLQEHDMLTLLNGTKPYTVFALDNDAMAAAKSSLGACANKVVRHHVLPHTVCTAAAQSGRVSAVDSAGGWLALERSDDGTVSADGVTLATTDRVATDGVLHQVNQFIVPNSAKGLSDLLKRTNHTVFLELLEKSGLLAEVDRMTNFTVFVPTSRVLAGVQDDLASLDQTQLRAVLDRHVIPKLVDSESFTQDMALDTQHGSPVHLRIHSNLLLGLAGLGPKATVECSPLVRVDGPVCNGVVHEVAGLLYPEEKSLLQLIKSRDDLTSLAKVLEGTKLEEELESGLGKQVTFLAPTNAAFELMGSDNVETLLKDKALSDSILRKHIVQEPTCCTGVTQTSWPFVSNVRTLAGSALEANRDRAGAVTFGGVTVAECDLLAKDGILHTMSRVLMSDVRARNTDVIFRRPFSDIILTGF